LAITGKAPFFMRLWGIPFVAFGLYALAGRFFYDAYRRSRTWYGVSGQRAIIVSDVWRTTEREIHPHTIPEIELDERSDGSGTIYFGKRPPIIRSSYSDLGGPPAFEHIDLVRTVFDLIRSTRTATPYNSISG